ncbi:cation:proton antiporter [Mucilaginibacter sp. UR6-1]|uniref:cation:proton antiporter domain-containing protein n=1 Tax=Mucilaginibacter sp. UR6-1 TaxID=1435643 RepID=UPI001E598AF6|nr:cation:proton antiporter [Mucilaginibacter sp. UR6-1]MCC8408662.1 cation:proton antiporter [Mucilaginibacter sp. UR6-1]
MSTYTTLMILCGLVIFSYLFDLIAGKTKLPSVLLLLFLGMAIRQVVVYFNWITPDFNKILPTLGTLGLILIVFEGALELKYTPEKNTVIKRSFLSALCILLGTTAIITTIFYYISGAGIYRCIINAIPFCVVSSAIAIPSASGLPNDKKEFIIYESSFSDILTIVFFNFMLSNKYFNFTAFSSLGGELLLILFFAVVSCLLLLYLIKNITHHVKFFLIISIIIMVYAIGQSYHLSALIVVLAFGLFLNNASQIRFPWFRHNFLYPQLGHELKQLLQLSAESAFLMRTFFFVLFGFTMNINQLNDVGLLVLGVLVLIAIYLVRFLYIKLVSKTDMMPELVLIPRGLISVLLFYNLPQKLQLPQIDTGLLFIVILSTSVIMSLGLLGSRKYKIPEGQEFNNV